MSEDANVQLPPKERSDRWWIRSAVLLFFSIISILSCIPFKALAQFVSPGTVTQTASVIRLLFDAAPDSAPATVIGLLGLVVAAASFVDLLVGSTISNERGDVFQKFVEVERTLTNFAISQSTMSNEVTTLIERVVLDKDDHIKRLSDENHGLYKRNSDLEQRLRDAALGERVCVDVTVSNFNNFLTYIPLYVALALGYFREENIDVKLEHGTSDLDAVKALADNHTQLAITDPIFAYHPEVRDLDPVLLSPFIHKVALWGVSRKPLEQLQAEASTNPPTILTFAEGTTAYNLTKLFADAKFQSQSGVPQYSLKPYALANGVTDHKAYLSRLLFDDYTVKKADIIVLSEPEITWIRRKWNSHTYTFSLQQELYPKDNFCFTAVLAKRAWVQTHPEVAKRFLKAIRVAYNFVYALPQFEEIDIRSGPLEGIPRENLAHQLAQSPLWQQVVGGVRSAIYDSYPSRLAIDDVDIVHVIEKLRTREFFPRCLTFDFDELKALRTAYAVSYSPTAEITARVYNIREHLQMAAE